MKNFLAAGLAGSLAISALTGCHSKKEEPAPAPPTAATTTIDPDPSQAAGSQNTGQTLSAARNSLKAGNVDEAAARLAQLQLQRATFNAQQAKDYRQVLSEAYDRAIEAAQRGDPKAQAALQLLRAAAPR